MNLAICSLASGSSGNCYLIYSKRAAVIVDAGISGKQMLERLRILGFAPEQIRAIMVTHEHSDHIRGLSQLAKKTGAFIYSAPGTIDCLEQSISARTSPMQPGDSLRIEDLEIKAFRVSHDAAEPLAFSFRSSGRQISIVTDTGVLTEEIRENMRDADILVLESNHDENILRMGRYPWFLKQRILGPEGHLSNDAAALGLLELMERDRSEGIERRRQVLLAHLSKENNFPEMALATVRNVLEAEGHLAGRDYYLDTLPRDVMSPVYWV
jgi:phosphoribosyl 1,2-cyclic phosphodiesterase